MHLRGLNDVQRVPGQPQLLLFYVTELGLNLGELVGEVADRALLDQVLARGFLLAKECQHHDRFEDVIEIRL